MVLFQKIKLCFSVSSKNASLVLVFVNSYVILRRIMYVNVSVHALVDKRWVMNQKLYLNISFFSFLSTKVVPGCKRVTHPFNTKIRNFMKYFGNITCLFWFTQFFYWNITFNSHFRVIRSDVTSLLTFFFYLIAWLIQFFLPRNIYQAVLNVAFKIIQAGSLALL